MPTIRHLVRHTPAAAALLLGLLAGLPALAQEDATRPMPTVRLTPPGGPVAPPADATPLPLPPPPALTPPPNPAADRVGQGDVKKCVQGGQVTYTNGDCASGSEVSGVGASAPATSTGGVRYAPIGPVSKTGVRAGPVSSEASCAYLRAEVERLGRDARAAGLPDTLRSTLEGQWGQARARAKAGGC